MSKRQKEAVYLRYFENMSNEEIATVMRVKYQTATNLIHEALSSLRESFSLSSLTTLLIFLRLDSI
ncbi:RNA polymerase sigma factor [Telluribacter humicola]|uniref:RNA polymerase sigma factor n=1 Tax=Telluribacter humicola TaxID=1720261 RepID=UPI001A976803|nr:sigma-70 family RNA polymerase sigma factor [Telluribacter humicola]